MAKKSGLEPPFMHTTNMVKILMMSAKMVTPGLLKIKIFWKKPDEVIISVHGVTNIILSRD